ncbi:ATP-dependent dethiobiotin synthetase BioD [Rhodococcus sp. (in: high G+C Gram-positive bacteria)]|uniref:ATP-dependent dethiobiotin synthetase BioD n=1 Tax=Rhodococcus sp. TaxID=1831 RepID=UPI0025D84928|nr:dethiobiotin synthase [Rhodococcus sp. (in: high G+C Gram-positive bacteria)]
MQARPDRCVERRTGDLAHVERLTGVSRLFEFARYPDPLASNVAARWSALPELVLDDVVTSIRRIDADVVLVEGAGGLHVRFGDTFALPDVARRLEAPVLVVCSAGLGALNHTELTTSALSTAGVRCAGRVVAVDTRSRGSNHVSELTAVSGFRLLGRVPEGARSLARREFVDAAPPGLHTTSPNNCVAARQLNSNSSKRVRSRESEAGFADRSQ